MCASCRKEGEWSGRGMSGGICPGVICPEGNVRLPFSTAISLSKPV